MKKLSNLNRGIVALHQADELIEQVRSEKVQARITHSLDLIDQGKSLEEVQLGILVSDGMSADEAKKAAASIRESASIFERSYKSALDDPDAFIKRFMDSIDKGRNCYERCNFWIRFIAALDASAEDLREHGCIDQDTIKAKVNAIRVDHAHATEEFAEVLREQAADALRQNDIMLSTMRSDRHIAKKFCETDSEAGVVISLEGSEYNYRCILATTIYAAVKAGEIKSIPVEADAKSVTTYTCTQMERIKIYDQLERKSVPVDIASKILCILGIVALAALTMDLIGVATGFAFAAFNPIFAIPFGLMLVAGISHVYNKCLDSWERESKHIVVNTVVAAKTILSSAEKLWNYFTTKVIPSIVDKVRTVCSTVFAHKTESTESESAE